VQEWPALCGYARHGRDMWWPSGREPKPMI